MAPPHPRDGGGLQGRNAPQPPEDPGRRVGELRLDHVLRQVGLKEFRAEGAEDPCVRIGNNEDPRR